MEAAKLFIMVVDDEPQVLEAIRLMLEDVGGYQVWTATNGRHALERLEAALARRRQQGFGGQVKYLPDLILSDILMPVLDGYDFYEQTRANPYLNHIPFIFLTAKQDEADIRRGKELGVDDYLTKPFKTEDLLASVRGKLRRVSQRREITAQVVGDANKPAALGVVILLGLIFLIILVTVVITMMWLG
ncbi:MAG: response regulator [Anaerolineae bacterium]|nr:response regulator [Anaerolineae bacterium]